MAYTRINWQNEPSEATALNDVNLNKMDSAIYDHDTRLDTDEASLANKVDKVVGKGLSTNDYTDADKAIVGGVTTALAGKVDKEAGKGLSSNDYTTEEKNKLAGISVGAKNVSISDTLADGDTIANVTIDGVTTPIKASKSEEMNVRSAMMLLTPPISNNAPYVKRVVGGGIANSYLCKLKKLVGASVVWNQLANDSGTSTEERDGVKFTKNSAGHWTLTGTPTNSNVFKNINYAPNVRRFAYNHVYYAKKGTTASGIGLYFLNVLSGGDAVDSISGDIVFKVTDNTSTANWVRMQVLNKQNVDIGTVSLTLQYFDLTAMFGSTIADYVKTLETQTAGSGIAWLKSYGFFTEEYYAYSTNTMQSVSVSGKKNVGKNRFKITATSNTVNGVTFTVNNDGTITANGTASGPAEFLIYSNNSESCPYIGYILSGCPSGGSMTTFDLRISDVSITASQDFGNGVTVGVNPTGKWRFVIMIRSGYTAKNLVFKPMIRFADVADSTYSPYTETTYPLDHTELRGLFKLDANNNLYADGDEYFPSGGENVKYAVTEFDGSNDEAWANYSVTQGNLFRISIPTRKSGELSSIGSIVEKYDVVASANRANMTVSGSTTYFDFINNDIADMTAWRTYLSNNHIKAVYELATPTTATLTTYTSLQNIESGGTEEFIDYGVSQGTRDVAIPCGQESEYNSGVSVPNLPTSGGKVELTYNPANGQFTWE